MIESLESQAIRLHLKPHLVSQQPRDVSVPQCLFCDMAMSQHLILRGVVMMKRADGRMVPDAQKGLIMWQFFVIFN